MEKHLSSKLGDSFIAQAQIKNQTVLPARLKLPSINSGTALLLIWTTLAIHYVRKSEAELNRNISN